MFDVDIAIATEVDGAPAGDEDAIGRSAGVHGAEDEFGIADLVALRCADAPQRGRLSEKAWGTGWVGG